MGPLAEGWILGANKIAGVSGTEVRRIILEQSKRAKKPAATAAQA